MRKVLGAIIILAASTSAIAGGDETLQPLDSRTRCILVFHQCLRDVADKDIDALLSCIADGGSRGNFRIHASSRTLSPDLKRELDDPAKFFDHNFPRSAEIAASFDKIMFSPLRTETEAVTVRNFGDRSTLQGKQHVITIKIPEFEDEKFRTIRFVEVAGRLYWVPFGW